MFKKKKKKVVQRILTVLTQTVCILALQMPPSGRADLLGLAPGKPDSTVVPVSWLVALKPCKYGETKSLLLTVGKKATETFVQTDLKFDEKLFLNK